MQKNIIKHLRDIYLERYKLSVWRKLYENFGKYNFIITKKWIF